MRSIHFDTVSVSLKNCFYIALNRQIQIYLEYCQKMFSMVLKDEALSWSFLTILLNFDTLGLDDEVSRFLEFLSFDEMASFSFLLRWNDRMMPHSLNFKYT